RNVRAIQEAHYDEAQREARSRGRKFLFRAVSAHPEHRLVVQLLLQRWTGASRDADGSHGAETDHDGLSRDRSRRWKRNQPGETLLRVSDRHQAVDGS